MSAANRTAAKAFVRYAGLRTAYFVGALALHCTLLQSQGLTPQVDRSQSKTELLKKINNPISDIMSLPVETNVLLVPDPRATTNYRWNIRPTIPFAFDSVWRLVGHLDVPVVSSQRLSGERTVGLGDTELTFVFTAKQSSPGLQWGFGPTWRLPTATDPALGPHRWGVGPAGAVVHQTEEWIFGAFGHQVWSFGGIGAVPVNATFVNPFMSHAWKSGLSVRAETESTYDWTSSKWTVPVAMGVSKLLPMGKQSMNVGGSFIYFAERRPVDPRWGVRFTANFVLRK